MNFNDKGLTVGELTMAVGALLVAALIWSSCTKQDDSSTKNLEPINPLLLENKRV